MLSKRRVLLVLLIPAVLNITISFTIGAYVSYQAYRKGLPPERIGIEIMKALYTYNFYWSIIQVGVGLYVIKLMGGVDRLKEKYPKTDITEKPISSVLLIILLFLVTQAILWIFLYVSALMYGGFEKYSEIWREMVSEMPLWSKIYLVAIAPFTAGIFEEIIWRWFGIEQLEKYYSSRTANIIQALAFGLWHGLSLHTIATFIIGLIYGQVYIRRRRLLVLSTAHVLTDIIGFSLAFL